MLTWEVHRKYLLNNEWVYLSNGGDGFLRNVEVRVVVRSLLETGRHFPFPLDRQLDLLVTSVVLRWVLANGMYGCKGKMRSFSSSPRPCKPLQGHHLPAHPLPADKIQEKTLRSWGMMEPSDGRIKVPELSCKTLPAKDLQRIGNKFLQSWATGVLHLP